MDEGDATRGLVRTYRPGWKVLIGTKGATECCLSVHVSIVLQGLELMLELGYSLLVGGELGWEVIATVDGWAVGC